MRLIPVKFSYKYFDILKGILLGLLLIAGTFPENDWTYEPGLDSSVIWVFNYLFAVNIQAGINIIFPHGPLAFLNYPLSSNIIITAIITSVLKVLMLINLYRIINLPNSNRWLLAFILSYFISIITGFGILLIINIILFYLNYYNSKLLTDKLIPFFLSASAIYTKLNFGIVALIISFSFLFYFLIATGKYKIFFRDILIIFFFFAGIWLVMYHSLNGFTNYITGIINLTQDNSSSASFYPDNNWWFLAIFLLIIFIIPFLINTKSATYFGFIITLSFFAAWKYGMARMDVAHLTWFRDYILISLLIIITIENKKRLQNFILLLCAIFLFYINMLNISYYYNYSYEMFRINNFEEFVSNLKKIKDNSIEKIKKNIAVSVLPKFLTDSIKNKSVDTYPWDYSIISANNFNWQPRVVIQSYASYTSWLDRQNACHFNSKKAPAFVVVQFPEIEGINGGNLNSIDFRYLLNDEPQTMIEILRNYHLYYSDNKYLIIEKDINPVNVKETITGKVHSRWGEWIAVPSVKNKLVRAKLKFNKNLPEKIKSFLYKDEQFWIYMKISGGIIHKYRIVPKNAEDGIWINPYICKTNGNCFGSTVDSVMFKCSNQSFLDQNINIYWNNIDFNNDTTFINKFFGLTKETDNKIVFSSENNPVKGNKLCWTHAPSVELTKDENSSPVFSEKVLKNSYSSTLSLPLDSIPKGDIKVNFDCWIKAKYYNKNKTLSIILSVENSSGNKIWKGRSVDDQLIDKDQWNNIYNFINYKNNQPGSILNAYIYNTSNEDIYIRDLKVVIQN